MIDESAILDAIDVAIHFANKEGHEYANAFENNGRWCAEYNSIENMIASAPTIIEADKSCSTCKYSDEVDGSNCYECVKGMKNNYKADSEVE